MINTTTPEETNTPYAADSVVVMETNIDDMNPQDFQILQERLFAAGALDVFFTSIMMKKMRPGTMLTCIGPVDRREMLGEMILRHSSSIGVRWRVSERMTLRRSFMTFSSSFGEITLKLSTWGNEVVRVTPEYDDLHRMSQDTGLPVGEIRSRILGEYYAQNKTGE